MFSPRLRPLLVVCLLLLDIFIARNIASAQALTKNSSNQVLGTQTTHRIIVMKISPTPTPDPTLTPTPTPAPATPTPTQAPAQATQITSNYSGGLQNLLDQVNAFRESNGLSPVQSDSNTCNLAATRAQEISNGFDHSGFENRVSSHTLPYPSYHEVTENIAMNSDSAQIVQMWIDSPEHNENMRKDTPYICIQNFGNYYAYEGWRP